MGKVMYMYVPYIQFTNMFKTNVISAAVEKTQQMSSAFSLREYQNKKSKQTKLKKKEKEKKKNTQ